MSNPRELGEEKVGKLLWKFSLPAITGMLVNALYNIIDSIFVGNGVGEVGLAAVTIAFPIMLILMGFGMLIGVGATALISIRLGEKKKEEAEKILGNALSMVILLAIILTSSVLFFLDPILIKLGAESTTLPYARDFSRIILLGSIFSYIGFGLNNVIRAEGKPKIAMATMVISAILNAILNPLFIFIFKLGISGSALATVISQAVSACIVITFFLSGKSYLKLRWHNLKLDRKIIDGIVAIGISPFSMQVAASIVTVLFNHSLLLYNGELAVAAMGIINRVGMVILMPIFGISQGVQPIIGYNYGAQNYTRVKAALTKAIVAATMIATAGLIFVQLLDVHIIRLFNDNQELINLGSVGLRLSLVMLPIIGFQVISTTYFQAVGKPKQAIFLSLSRQVLILIPMIFLLPRILGLTGVWLASPVADLISSILTGVLLFIEIRHLKSCN